MPSARVRRHRCFHFRLRCLLDADARPSVGRDLDRDRFRQRDLNAGQERTARAFEMAARAAHWERRSGDLSGLQMVSKQDRQPPY
jgi:hypothetical protein